MKKVLLICDAGRPTGFERVGRAIGTALAESGRYEVVCRGIGYFSDSALKVPPYPYQLKPIGTDKADPAGLKTSYTWVPEDQPDVVIMVQDIWTQLDYLQHLPPDLLKMGYYPVDTPNMKWSFAVVAAALDDAVPYTRFGAHETAVGVRSTVDLLYERRQVYGLGDTNLATRLEIPRKDGVISVRMDRLAALQNPANFVPIPHAGEPELFFPEDRATSRRMMFGPVIPEDAFVVMSVNTNQFRKRQDITIRAFAQLLERVPNAYLVLHSAGGNDFNGWDLSQLAQLYGIQDRMLCTHWMRPELSGDELRRLYNCADVHVNNGGGEGWGLTTHESALCRVAQIVPDWSATGELWKDAAMLLPVKEYRFEPKFLNTAHAVINPEDLANRLEYLYRNPLAKDAIADSCYERARKFPRWEEVGRRFVDRVDALFSIPAPTPLSITDVLAARQGDLKSRLWDKI